MENYKWLFNQIRHHVAGFTKRLEEEIKGYKNSVVEHTEGLELLKQEPEKCGNIIKQFNTIIENHTLKAQEIEEQLHGAQASFDKVLQLEKFDITPDTVMFLEAIAAILQLEPEKEE